MCRALGSAESDGNYDGDGGEGEEDGVRMTWMVTMVTGMTMTEKMTRRRRKTGWW